ncbi:hypothetical protein C8A01DRAFT_45227 [Parachaetomium inaequale]|uniref:Ubiquitin-like protease family profile domain-containing protein n=1 Tax=Parachaetomium inaequale TaxID=2588326 RepID=A0AAN6PIN3_9PEZI|nr:hypothetical protein C8A01DRAFT_45227 [Parachaetomium inaequale]
MPPGSSKTAFAPRTHVNTLDSSPGCPPGLPQTSTSRPTGQPPPSKRQKTSTDTRRRGPNEDIIDDEQDATSRTERHGSQSTFSHSVSPGIPEYQTVAAYTKPGPNHPPVMIGHGNRAGVTRKREPIEESFDQRIARLVSTAGAKASACTTRDSADDGILGKTTRPGQHARSLNQAKKRPSHEIADDEDELVETNGEEATKAGTGQPNEVSPRRGPSSLSRRGDMKPTKWTDNTDTNMTVFGARVQAAVCEPNLRYLVNDGRKPCFLRPTNVPELRAVTHGNNPAEPSDWLKITGKAKSLAYHPESNIIRISQATDPSASIGRLMLLNFCSNDEASWVADWARKNLSMKIVRERERSWDKTNEEISHAGSQASVRRLSDATPTRRPQTAEEVPRTNVALPESGSASSRTPLRYQMQVSGQQHMTPLARAETSSELVSSGTRSLRTRQIAQPVQTFETPRIPVIHRWSDENPDWSKDWKMPLITRRTTVDKEDIPRLDEGQCLNDNLIGYGLRYLFDVFKDRAEDLHTRVYFHNSFFYEKLKAGRGAINYDGVKNWTAKVDLLSYDYIVVPVNEHYHWWVAIICNPGKLDPDSRALPGRPQGPSDEAEGNVDKTALDVEMTDVTETRPLQSPRAPAADEIDLVKSDIVNLVSDDKDVSVDLTSASRTKQTKKSKSGARTYNPEDPRIITLDSLGSNHPQGINLLKKYLLAEFEHKRGKLITDLPQQLGMRAINIPEQDNLCDCGVYLLGYIQEFVKNPNEFVRMMLQKEPLDWNFNPSALRELWRVTILEEHKAEQLKAKEKRESSAAKRTPKRSAEPSRDPSRETGGTNATNDKHGRIMDSYEESASRKTSSTPTKPGVRGVDGSGTKPASRSPLPNGSEQRQSSVTVPARSPQRHPHRQDSPVEVVVILPSQEDSDVLPSVEAPDVEELPNPPPQPPKDPNFLHRLSSTSASESSDDEDTPMEVSTDAFYAPHGAKPSTQQKTATPSSSAKARRRRAAKAKAPPKHTTSRFAAPDSPGLEAVVERAEVVRQPEPIDLT